MARPSTLSVSKIAMGVAFVYIWAQLIYRQQGDKAPGALMEEEQRLGEQVLPCSSSQALCTIQPRSLSSYPYQGL